MEVEQIVAFVNFAVVLEVVYCLLLARTVAVVEVRQTELHFVDLTEYEMI